MDISTEAFENGRKEERFTIIDVREQLEYHSFNLGGINIPLGRLAAAIEEEEFDKDEAIVVLCQRGLRSKTAAQMLVAAGYTRVQNLAGGLLAWNKKYHE